MSNKLNQIQPLADEIEAWGDVPPLTGHTLFAEAATEKQRAELERVKAEIRRRETGGTSSVAEINAIHELKREKAEVERGELHADNRSMLILKIGLRASRLHDLFKCANAAKRQMRRERDAAYQSRNRIVWLVRRYCALNQMNLAFFLDSEKLLRDARINLDAANKRAEQAEFELVEAQSRLIAGGVYEKLDSVNYWKTRAEQAEAQRDAAILKRDAAIKRAQISEAGRAEAEADARALAERVFETEILTDSEIEIVARYIQREQMERAGYLK